MLDSCATSPDVTVLSSPIGLRGCVPSVVHLNRRMKPGIGEAEFLDPMTGEQLHLYRRYLETCAPGLAAFARSVRLLLWQGAQVIGVDKLDIAEAEIDEKRHILYALAHLIGRPTATDPRDRKALWDIKAREFGSEYFPTFSEHDREADHHTDTQYYPNPERYLLLYAVRAARCGGGLNTFATGARILSRMEESADGREAIRQLATTRVPFRIPSAFADSDEPQFTWAPVIAETPLLRFRTDTILDGERHFPGLDWTRLRQALDLFLAAAENVQTEPALLPDDGLVFVNNHDCLHARTAFADRERHLIRIRMHG